MEREMQAQRPVGSGRSGAGGRRQRRGAGERPQHPRGGRPHPRLDPPAERRGLLAAEPPARRAVTVCRSRPLAGCNAMRRLKRRKPQAVRIQPMKPFLMGTETEYAVTGRSANGADRARRRRSASSARPCARSGAGCPTRPAAGRRTSSTAAASTWTPAATPNTPRPNAPPRPQVALYDKAGERLLRPGAERAQREHPGTDRHRGQEQRRPDPRRRRDLGLPRVVHLLGARRQGGRAAGAARRQPAHLRRCRLPVRPAGLRGLRAVAARPPPARRCSAPTRPATARSSARACARRRTTGRATGRGAPDRQGLAAGAVRHLPDVRHHRAAVPDGQRRPQGRPGAGAGRPGEGRPDDRLRPLAPRPRAAGRRPADDGPGDSAGVPRAVRAPPCRPAASPSGRPR